MIVELSEEEAKYISECILMSAREGFWLLDDSKIDEPYGYGVNLVKKLGITDKNLLEDIERG